MCVCVCDGRMNVIMFGIGFLENSFSQFQTVYGCDLIAVPWKTGNSTHKHKMCKRDLAHHERQNGPEENPVRTLLHPALSFMYLCCNHSLGLTKAGRKCGKAGEHRTEEVRLWKLSVVSLKPQHWEKTEGVSGTNC